jgi:hypothetical protein
MPQPDLLYARQGDTPNTLELCHVSPEGALTVHVLTPYRAHKLAVELLKLTEAQIRELLV